ncbi:MAG TPA: RDD family protein [Pyrinomonadaceae bacterium]|nr:RDD family protein [Pyrinomonadaceae bacterium]
MTLCPSCGAENAEGTKFCVKCGAGLAAAPSPGSWEQPSPPSASSGSPYDTPTGGTYGSPSGGLGSQPGAYQPMGGPPAYGYPGGMATTGPGGLNYAVWADRVLAALVDGALVLAAIIVLYIIIGVIGGIGSAALGSISEDAGGLFATGSCCVFFVLPPLATLIVSLYNKIYLIGTRGYSIGQGVMNLKVVMGDGSPVTMNTSIIRFLVQFGLGIVPLVGWILVLLDLLWPLWDVQRQTLHDKAVGTFVVKRT